MKVEELQEWLGENLTQLGLVILDFNKSPIDGLDGQVFHLAKQIDDGLLRAFRDAAAQEVATASRRAAELRPVAR